MNQKDMAWPLPGYWCPIAERPPHPGAFSAVRRYDIHTGVDLYAPEGQEVVAIEDGLVVAIDPEFTGGEDTPKGEDGEPVWHQTAAVMVEGVSGVILYGELRLAESMFVGIPVYAGQTLGYVKKVLKDKPGKTHGNPAQSPSMLHLELYEHGATKAVWWWHDEPRPEGLLDPTTLLLSVRGAP